MIIENLVLKNGDVFEVTDAGSNAGYGVVGDKLTVVCILDKNTIGVCGERYHKQWHNLDGKVRKGYGIYLNSVDLSAGYLKRVPMHYIIQNDCAFNDLNLKGKECRLIHTNKRGDVCLVELNENVGAGGADGLGKYGHCIFVPNESLRPVEEKTSKAKKATAPPTVVSPTISFTNKTTFIIDELATAEDYKKYITNIDNETLDFHGID